MQRSLIPNGAINEQNCKRLVKEEQNECINIQVSDVLEQETESIGNNRTPREKELFNKIADR